VFVRHLNHEYYNTSEHQTTNHHVSIRHINHQYYNTSNHHGYIQALIHPIHEVSIRHLEHQHDNTSEHHKFSKKPENQRIDTH
jgi:hypothetical protein